MASDLHTFSRIIHQFGGAAGVGKNEQKINLGNLTPTKRRLIQNQNLKTLMDGFEWIPGEFNPRQSVSSDSLVKRRKFNCGGGR